ncbi:MAG: porin [Hyphomicrobiales bacterium]|nr:porin [Hyphomicrobiales bacterium]
MGRSSALTLAALALVAGASAASAADMLMPLPAAPRMAPAPAPEFSGWYLRGDVGVGVDSTASWSMTPNRMLGNGTTYVPTAYTQSSAHVSSPVFIGFGAGYQVNNWFRVDGTVEYRGASRFSSNSELVFQDQTTTPVTSTSLRTFNRGDLSSWVGLVNGYVDLGTWAGITPYVGAGVGVARNKVSGMIDQGSYATTGATTANGSSGGYYGEGTKTNFAWALMAGLGYDVSSRLKLEIGYRYLDTGKTTTGGLNCYGGTGCGNISLLTRSNVSQDIKMGMRWMLSDAAPAPVYDAPLVRKY